MAKNMQLPTLDVCLETVFINLPAPERVAKIAEAGSIPRAYRAGQNTLAAS